MSGVVETAGFRAVLEAERPRVEAGLERAVEALAPALGPRLTEPVRWSVLSGGKRLRPILCVAAYRAVRGSVPEPVYDLAAALELVHAYSLMHDDLPCMDDAALRRGRSTPHTLFGERVTAIAGVALIPGAALQVWRSARALGCDEDVARRLVRSLMAAAGGGGMVGGQALDLLGEDQALAGDALDDLHRRKTGALLTAALQLGAQAAGASGSQEAALTRYGRAVGLAFQIMDDVLDATASTEELGKNPSDAEHGKSTYVSLHGVEEARRRARDQVDEARAALDEAHIDSPELRSLADYIVMRRR